MKERTIDPNWRAKAGLQIPTAAAVLDCCDTTVWKLISLGELETFQIGRSRRVKTSSIIAKLDGDNAMEAA